MTWHFLYLAAFTIGLALAMASGLLRRLPFLPHHRYLVIPHVEQHRPFAKPVLQRVAVALLVFGVVGSVLELRDRYQSRSVLLITLGVATLATLVIAPLLRPICPPGVRAGGCACIVCEIPAGGYGQVRIETAGESVVMAAHNVDEGALAAGTEVEVVECDRSVVQVRKARTA